MAHAFNMYTYARNNLLKNIIYILQLSPTNVVLGIGCHLYVPTGIIDQLANYFFNSFSFPKST